MLLKYNYLNIQVVVNDYISDEYKCTMIYHVDIFQL